MRNSPHPIDVPAEMEEVRKRLQPLTLPSPKMMATASPRSMTISPSPLRGPQDMMMEVVLRPSYHVGREEDEGSVARCEWNGKGLVGGFRALRIAPAGSQVHWKHSAG